MNNSISIFNKIKLKILINLIIPFLIHNKMLIKTLISIIIIIFKIIIFKKQIF